MATKKILGHFHGGLGCKESACNAADPDLVPVLERPFGEGNGNVLQYSCLENLRTGDPSGLQSMELKTVRHN